MLVMNVVNYVDELCKFISCLIHFHYHVGDNLLLATVISNEVCNKIVRCEKKRN
jgi:hypothetical protein